MTQPLGIPLSSHEIPAGTGLVQSIECKGIKHAKEGRSLEDLLTEPVTAQITTFANGVRRVCCPQAVHNTDGEVTCGRAIGLDCIYSWDNTSGS